MSTRSKPRLISGLLALSAATALSVPALNALAGDGVAKVSGKRLVMKAGKVETTSRTDAGAGSSTQAASSVSTDSGSTATASDTGDQGSVGSCTGVVVDPGRDIQAVINANPAGTTLCLAAGTFTTSSPITPKNGMQLIGAGKNVTSITTSSATTVIELRGRSDVLLEGFDVSGAVGSLACKPACGRGIRAGVNTVIDDVRSHHNAISGIGGAGPNLLVRDSELDHNGRSEFFGCCASGIKTGTAYRIENSYVHDNVGMGIWCDVGCKDGTFEVYGNTVVGNAVGGIRYETSASPAMISGNTVRGNNLVDKGGHGGIEVNSSQNAVVQGNVVGGNLRAGITAGGRREPGLDDVLIRNNTLNGDKLAGCGGEVVCTSNT